MTARRTPLHSWHLKQHARMVQFAGWELPVQYRSALDEHHAVRRSVGVFDVSHMGRIEISGPNALDFVQRMSCNDVSRLQDGQAHYSALLTEAGTFLDDIVVYRFDSRRILLCVNAATTSKDFEWLAEHAEEGVEIRNRSEELAQIAVQGPETERLLQPMTEEDLSAIRFYWFQAGLIDGRKAIFSRTGYTGEPGFELYLSPGDAIPVVERIFDAGAPLGVLPAGLAARNTLRLEVRYPLYGSDINESTTPFEAGLSWIVKLGTGFVGEEALRLQKERGLTRKLAGLELTDPGVLRDGFALSSGGREAGRITSGGYSPTLGKSIGLAYLPIDLARPGTALEVDIRGKKRNVVVVETPFYRRD